MDDYIQNHTIIDPGGLVNQIFPNDEKEYLKIDTTSIPLYTSPNAIDINAIGKNSEFDLLKTGMNNSSLFFEDPNKKSLEYLQLTIDKPDSIYANGVNPFRLANEMNLSGPIMPSVPAIEADEYIPSYPGKVELTDRDHGAIKESIREVIEEMGIDSETISEKVVEKLHYKGVDKVNEVNKHVNSFAFAIRLFDEDACNIMKVIEQPYCQIAFGSGPEDTANINTFGFDMVDAFYTSVGCFASEEQDSSMTCERPN